MYSSHAYPNFEKLFVLHTDAPKDGLGAVLYQHQNDILCIVAYGSRTLTPAKKNYHLHSGKLEFLAPSVTSLEITFIMPQASKCTQIIIRLLMSCPRQNLMPQASAG